MARKHIATKRLEKGCRTARASTCRSMRGQDAPLVYSLRDSWVGGSAAPFPEAAKVAAPAAQARKQDPPGPLEPVRAWSQKGGWVPGAGTQGPRIGDGAAGGEERGRVTRVGAEARLQVAPEPSLCPPARGHQPRHPIAHPLRRANCVPAPRVPGAYGHRFPSSWAHRLWRRPAGGPFGSRYSLAARLGFWR